MTKSILTMVAALAATVGYAGDSAPFRLDTMEGTRVARAEEVITYSTEWDNAGKVIVAVDGVTLKEASAPASGDVIWNAGFAGKGDHTLTYTTYKNGVADKVETVTYKVTMVSVQFYGGSLGSVTHTKAVEADKAIGTLPTPTRTGYTFAGWWTAASGGTQISASTTVSGNVTYYAHWTVNQYTATFNANGGTGGTTKTQEYGTSLSAPTVTRTGYMFKGWYTEKSGGTKIKTSTKVKKDVTYYAQWTANKYTIKFDKNGGTGSMKSLSATYGKSVTLTANAFKRTNWTFLGWATKKDAAAAEYKNKAKVKNLSAKSGGTATLYAVWKQNTYTVKFSANGGEGGTVKQTVGCGTKTALATNGFTRAGFTFAGWATKKDGSVAYKNKAKVKDLAKSGKSLTLYAVWKPADWAVGTFTGTGDIGNTSVKKRKAATVTLTVSSTGKISGKFALSNGKSYSFKADAFTEFKDGALCVETTIKYGSKKCALLIAVSQDEETGAAVADLLVTYNGKAYGEALLR